MKTHQFNKEMLPDELFEPGELRFLVIGNECRLLDKRRTPGFIKEIDLDAGFFRWEITDFEDKGRSWEVEFERVNTYQFKNDCAVLSDIEIDKLKSNIVVFAKNIEIKASKISWIQTNEKIASLSIDVIKWLERNSSFLKEKETIDFQSLNGPKTLRGDFNKFISSVDLSETELRTAEAQVLNPHSGDWIKAMQIVMAEMGLKDYKGRDVRSKKAFDGIGSKANRIKYIQYRLAFMRAIFNQINVTEVELYRGMSTEWEWKPDSSEQYRFWSSWTFSHKVAEDFSELKPATKQKNSYLVKRSMQVNKLFMTFLETDAMNGQYLEAEAILLHDEDDRMLW
ncbi:MAG: hypothetical protein ACXVCP_02415 [Bdellovibrio sp.]